MRSYILISVTLIFLSNKVLSQEVLDSNRKLFATAKVWGFLKYYHPKVASGKFDWGKQLLEILPSIDSAKTKEELSSIHIAWIQSLGKVKSCRKCNNSDESIDLFEKNFDLSWMKNDQLFTNELQEELKYIEQNRYQGRQHYVAMKGNPSTLTLKNEELYPNFKWTNKQLRLLSLFRYWNTIEYFYPHKYQINTDWDEVFIQMLPKFNSPISETDYHLAMLELVVKIDDSHGYFTTDVINNFFGNKQIPADFKIIDKKLIINHLYNDSLARVNDIRIGDIITQVEGIEVAEIINEKLKYVYGANERSKMRYSFRKILHGSTDGVKVKMIRNGEVFDKILYRYSSDQFKPKANPSEPWKLINNKIGYLNLGTLDKKSLIQALYELIDTQAIIIDLRNYPKGFYGFIFKNFFGARNETVAKQLNVYLSYPGKFIISEQRISLAEPKYKGKVILIVNERTQSRSEYTAMWIQNGYNVITIGSQTSGAGGVMISLPFVGNFNSYFTSSGVFYPDMTPLQRNGVKIDLEIKPTIDGIIQGRDELLEKAVELASD